MDADLELVEADELSELQFPAAVFQPSSSSSGSASTRNSATSAGSSAASARQQRQPSSARQSSREVVQDLLADHEKVARTEFTSLIESLTASLRADQLEAALHSPEHRPAQDQDQCSFEGNEEEEEEEDEEEDQQPFRAQDGSRTAELDYRTNPFHPHYNLHNMQARQPTKGPILPFEASTPDLYHHPALSSMPATASTKPQVVPTLDLRDEPGRSAWEVNKYKPSDVLLGLSQTNPFRTEAWAEPAADPRSVQTARPPNDDDLKANNNRLHALTELDGATNPTMTSKKVTEDEDDLDAMVAAARMERVLSTSAPTTVRKPAPCAVAYPSTSVFIQLVNSAFEAGLAPQEGRFFYDGCCTVSAKKDAVECRAGQKVGRCVVDVIVLVEACWRPWCSVLSLADRS